MPSPKPKPTALRILQGKPGHRPLNAHEPKPDAAIPDCPAELSADAKAEWARLSPYLLRVGLITTADKSAFAAYCQAYGRWIDAERKLADEGELLLTDKNNLVQNPRLWVANKALDQMYKFMVEFGLTPSSRTRLKVSPAAEDEMDKFMKRGNKLRQA